MQSKLLNRLSSTRENKIRNQIWFALLLSVSILLINGSFISSAQADPGAVLSGGGGGGVTGIPGTLGNADMNGSETSVENSSDNVNLWHKYEYNSQPRMPISDPSGSGSGAAGSSGSSRELQAAPSPPKESSISSFVPPHPVTFQQPQEMLTTMNGAGDTPSVQSDGLPITETQYKAARAVAMEMSRQMDSSVADKIPSILASAETLKQFGSSWIGESAQVAFGAGLGSMAGIGASAGGASGGDGGELDSLLNALISFPSPGLINVANESSGIPTISLIPFKSIPQAVWMVQQMYKHFSVPLALLLLLPGAVITQLKSQIASNFNLKTEDATSPFEGILRAMIAIFLIPATQLIVSYSIDVGNSLAYSVNPAVGVLPIIGWLQQVAYSTQPQNSDNAVLPPKSGGLQQEEPDGGGTGGGLGNPFSMLQGGSLSGSLGGLLGGGGGGGFGGGLAAGESDDQSVPEQQSGLSSTLQTMFNVMIYIFSIGMLLMTATQLTIMCYLFLLGPVAAAFFAWPSVKGKIFRPVFGNWVNAVITVSLWRFYWMIILAIMTNRLLNLGENGSMLFNLQWEVAIFTCLIGLLFYVPMNPWQFDPGQAYRVAKFYGESIMQSASKGGSGGKEGGGSKNGGAQEGNGGANNGDNSAQKSSSPSSSSSNSVASTNGGNNVTSSSNSLITASTSGAESGSSKESSAGKSPEKAMPADTSGVNYAAATPPPVGQSNGGTNNGGKNSPDSSLESASNNNQSAPPPAQLAALSSPVNPGGSNGGAPSGGSAPYSLSPPSGGDLGGQGNPSIAFNPSAGAGAVQSSLQQNYGNLLPTAGSGGLEAPPTTDQPPPREVV